MLSMPAIINSERRRWAMYVRVVRFTDVMSETIDSLLAPIEQDEGPQGHERGRPGVRRESSAAGSSCRPPRGPSPGCLRSPGSAACSSTSTASDALVERH